MKRKYRKNAGDKAMRYVIYGANFFINPIRGLLGFGARVAEDTDLIKKDNAYLGLGRLGFATVSAVGALSTAFGIATFDSDTLYALIEGTGEAAMAYAFLRDTGYLENPKKFGNDLAHAIRGIKKKASDLEIKSEYFSKTDTFDGEPSIQERRDNESRGKKSRQKRR